MVTYPSSDFRLQEITEVHITISDLPTLECWSWRRRPSGHRGFEFLEVSIFQSSSQTQARLGRSISSHGLSIVLVICRELKPKPSSVDSLILNESKIRKEYF